MLERNEERVLDGVLGDVEAARRPDQGRDRTSRLASERAVDDGPRVAGYCAGPSNFWIGRTSIEPQNAAGHFFAASSASSRLATSIT